MNGTNTETKAPRMMRIREVAATGILPENALRQLYRRGELPGIQLKGRFLVNYDALVEMLNSSMSKKK